MRDFRGKRVLVTGGARGVGLAIARRFGREGAVVVLADLDEEALTLATRSLAADEITAHAVRLDVTDVDGIDAVRSRIHAMAGPLQVVINNAGVVFGGPFLDVSLERHLATFRVNIEGVVAVTHTFLPDLIAADEGYLVNVASASGFVGLPFGSTYASSKWAVIGFSESIRLELETSGHEHVGVTTVCPSYVDTGMFDGARPPLLTNFLTPDDLADKVLLAVQRGKPLVLEPWLVKLTPFLAHALPKVLTDRIAEAFGASTTMAEWRGRGG